MYQLVSSVFKSASILSGYTSVLSETNISIESGKATSVVSNSIYSSSSSTPWAKLHNESPKPAKINPILFIILFLFIPIH